MTAAQTCNVPAMLTEQYPKGLGKTMPAIATAAGNSPVIEKLHFSCMAEPHFRDAFTRKNRKQAVLAGMEAHVCVVQTAAGLLEMASMFCGFRRHGIENPGE